MDSNEGGPEESDSELEEGMGEDLGGDATEKPLSKHLGHETGCLKEGLVPCGQGAGVLLQVHTDSKLQDPPSKACEGLSSGFWSFLVAISVKIFNVLALPHLGSRQLFIHSQFFFSPFLLPY